ISPPARTRSPNAASREWFFTSMVVSLTLDRIETGRKCASHEVLGRFARLVAALRFVGGQNGQHDVVTLFFELQNQLHAGNLVQKGKVDGGSRAEKIHRFGGVSSPRLHVFEVEARFFLLNQNPHSLQSIGYPTNSDEHPTRKR